MVEEKKIKKKILKDIDYPLVSYIVGIVAIVQSIISPLSGIILSIVGLVLSKRIKSELSRIGKKFNLIALIIGTISFVLSIVLSLYITSITSSGFI